MKTMAWCHETGTFSLPNELDFCCVECYNYCKVSPINVLIVYHLFLKIPNNEALGYAEFCLPPSVLYINDDDNNKKNNNFERGD